MSFLSSTAGYAPVATTASMTVAAPAAAMPVTTSVPVTTAVVPAVVPVYSVPYAMRITMADLKHGGEQVLKDELNYNQEVLDELDNLKGRIQFTGFFMEDATGKTHVSNKMVVGALYDSMANLEANLPVNKKIFGQYAYWLDGAPEIFQGPISWYYKGRGTKKGKVAQRVTLVPIKPGSAGMVLDVVYRDPTIYATLDDPLFDTMIDLAMYFPDDSTAITVSMWSDVDSMDASQAKQAEAMKSLAPWMNGTPKRFKGMLEFCLPDIAGRKKPTTTGCLQC